MNYNNITKKQKLASLATQFTRGGRVLTDSKQFCSSY